MATTDVNPIESLRTFAMLINQIPFAHICTAALAGETWAVARIAEVTAAIKQRLETSERWYADAALAVIRATDTTRPDGATARSLKLKL